MSENEACRLRLLSLYLLPFLRHRSLLQAKNARISRYLTYHYGACDVVWIISLTPRWVQKNSRISEKSRLMTAVPKDKVESVGGGLGLKINFCKNGSKKFAGRKENEIV